MQEIMKFPEVKDMPSPKRLYSKQRDGYKLEKWEFYPLSQCVSTFLVPDTRFFTAVLFPPFYVSPVRW